MPLSQSNVVPRVVKGALKFGCQANFNGNVYSGGRLRP
ncbi:hypothetical protein GMES_2500 [Paraglaciecola mesophila KMM 241]|uniref:Uncharacterized protein n=1 Tax=Paraglaciecola mesophila KMM 241 TaxID=1128912 RepID=K6ZN80_9ALTE|nr:hypothetical protein GMES_2500 [Paraglaciecola mesophila KMM 241]